MAAQVPSVMISSTFYDLRQVRESLSNFISQELGYHALRSEHNSFPIDPDVNAIENCRRRVEQEADILILIIGGRYGSIDSKSAKSVTNLEYLTARGKSIPIYVFVDKQILSIIPIWKRNPDADFSDVVDDCRVFEFITEVRSRHQVWTQEFEYVQQIIDSLRIQFAYLTNESIRWRRQLSVREDRDILDNLYGESLRVALEKPRLWPVHLYAQIIMDEVKSACDLRTEQQLGLVLGPGERIPTSEIRGWMRAKWYELEQLASSVRTLIHESNSAMNEENVRLIVFVARKLSSAYREAIEWSLRIRRASMHEAMGPVKEEMVRIAEVVLLPIEKFGPELKSKINAHLISGEPDPLYLDMTFTFESPGVDEFERLIKQAANVILSELENDIL